MAKLSLVRTNEAQTEWVPSSRTLQSSPTGFTEGELRGMYLDALIDRYGPPSRELPNGLSTQQTETFVSQQTGLTRGQLDGMFYDCLVERYGQPTMQFVQEAA